MTTPVEISFVPIVSPISGKPLAAYVVASHPMCIAKTGAVFPSKATPDGLAEGARAMLEGLVSTIQSGAAPSRLVLPLSAKALVGTDNADKVLSALRQLDQAQRSSIIVEMHDLPTHISLDALETATIPLLLFVGGFIARMPPGLDDGTVFSNCNYMGLSISLDDGASDETAVRDAWVVTAPRRLKLFVWNMPAQLTDAAARMEVFGVI